MLHGSPSILSSFLVRRFRRLPLCMAFSWMGDNFFLSLSLCFFRSLCGGCFVQVVAVVAVVAVAIVVDTCVCAVLSIRSIFIFGQVKYVALQAFHWSAAPAKRTASNNNKNHRFLLPLLYAEKNGNGNKKDLFLSYVASKQFRARTADSTATSRIGRRNRETGEKMIHSTGRGGAGRAAVGPKRIAQFENHEIKYTQFSLYWWMVISAALVLRCLSILPVAECSYERHGREHITGLILQ